MSDITNIAIPVAQNDKDEAFVKYLLSKQAGDRETILNNLRDAASNWFCIAQDLGACALDAGHVNRVQLCTLLRYFHNRASSVYNHANAVEGGVNKTVSIVAALERLHTELLALRNALAVLGVDFALDLPTDNALPDHWLIPNAQPLELLITCILRSNDAIFPNLLALKNRLVATQLRQQHTINTAIQPESLKSGLPAVVFVCLTDNTASCSPDYWHSWSRKGKGLTVLKQNRQYRFNDQVHNVRLESETVRIKARWKYVNGYFKGKNANFMADAEGRRLSDNAYNGFVEFMYAIIPETEVSQSIVPGGKPIERTLGYNHLGESGRPFSGGALDGTTIFEEISRCWKCRFLHHYDIPRVQGNTTGLTPEDPKTTSWACNEPLNCAEDLCHYRCWRLHGSTGLNPDQEYAFMPFPSGQ
ncbi:hypothetical protein QWA68_012714 [Fusarium oxysporum]|nr:hypothetical protein QWA68_012714 [Fusarium oxysporum]